MANAGRQKVPGGPLADAVDAEGFDQPFFLKDGKGPVNRGQVHRVSQRPVEIEGAQGFARVLQALQHALPVTGQSFGHMSKIPHEAQVVKN